MLIERLNDKPKGESVTLCLYGASGTGKSWFCGSAGDRTLYIECENRLATVQSPAFKKKWGNWNPIVKQVTEEFLPEGGAKALDEITKLIREASTDYPDQFDTIIIDGASAFNRFALNKGLELNQKLGKSKTLTRIGLNVLNTEIAIIDLTVQDRTAEMGMVQNFIFKINDYVRREKKHFILTAHERLTYKEKQNITAVDVTDRIRPGFTGRTFPDEIPGMFDLVWYSEVVGSGDNANYRVRTEGDRSVVAKTCFNGIFKQIETNPNFQDILKRIRETK
jgi:hypothetical protein